MTKAQLIVTAAALVAAWSTSATVGQSVDRTAAGSPAIADSGVPLAQAAPPAASGTSDTSGGGPVSLVEALRIVERRTGGRARKIERERDDDIEVYEVKTISKDGPVEVIVDAVSGRIEDVEGPGLWDRIENFFDDEDRREDAAMLSALETAKVTLVGAIELAQAKSGGQAVKGRLKERNGKMLFEIRVVVDGEKHKVTVDPVTAKLVVKRLRKDGDDDDDDKDKDKEK